MSRGADALDARPGRRRHARLGLNPAISSGVKTEDEGLYPVQHGYWLETMRAAVAAEEARMAAGVEHPVCAHSQACDHA